MGAGNQQERLDPGWIVGFVDGEGCFHVAINRQPAMRLGWQVLPEFRVVQHRRDRGVLDSMQSYFGCGAVTVNNGDRMEFRVRGLKNLSAVVEFFESHPLRTKKRNDFGKFAQVIRLMTAGTHLTAYGLRKVAQLSLQMNRRRNDSASRILRDFTPIPPRGGEDKVRPPWRHGEAARNRDPPVPSIRTRKQTRGRGLESNRCERNTLSLNWRLA